MLEDCTNLEQELQGKLCDLLRAIIILATLLEQTDEELGVRRLELSVIVVSYVALGQLSKDQLELHLDNILVLLRVVSLFGEHIQKWVVHQDVLDNLL